MAVLTIAENKPKTPTGVAIGIDLGTTHSLVSVFHEGRVQVIPDETGAVLLPSIVHYTTEQTVVGHMPVADATRIASVKRLIGRTTADIAAAYGASADDLFELTGTELALKTVAGPMTPRAVSSEILKALYQRAQNFLKDETISGAVITVPAYFDEAQRKATKQAAQLAGIHVIRLINEPTAAAIAYGINQTEASTCLVFDLGGGTFDVSLLSMQRGLFEVLATGGDTLLGGDDVDQLIANWITKQPGVTASVEQCYSLARSLKESLSQQPEATVTVGAVTMTLNQAQLAELAQPLIETMIRHCERVLMDGKQSKTTIDQVILVGGSTRMPAIQAAVADWFGQAPCTQIHPDEAVAIGAALQADALTGNRSGQNLLLLDVIPLSLGLEMMSGTVEKMITRNTTVPCVHTENFTTYQDNQTGLMLHIVQGERELVADCRSLARFHLKGLPPSPAGQLKIAVAFQVDADGLLTVTAHEKSHDVQAEITVEVTGGLSDDAMNDLIMAGITHAADDMAQRALHEARFSGQAVLKVANADVAAHGAQLLTPEDHQALIQRLSVYADAIATGGLSEIKAAEKAVLPLVEHLAEKKLNYSLEQALAGKTVDEVIRDA